MAAVIGGTDVQQPVVAGAGARPVDSNGNPWTGAYIVSSGNLLADFTANVNVELQEESQENLPVPSNFPQGKEHQEYSYKAYNFSDGEHMADGSWASGPAPDQLGEFTYVPTPMDGTPMPPPTHPDARFYGTTEVPNVAEKAAGMVQDRLKRE